ncbi:hypothetical protein BDV93DRAFT_606847 [Ceratobasidium sp. AG-I]|nr:hypothetical protein BDV93DRAFT_606847 [Ceratobasidium sp. AG-I]
MPATAGTTTVPGRERYCGNCGQLGHMKTNHKCPHWAEFSQPGAIDADLAVTQAVGMVDMGGADTRSAPD